MTGDEHFLTATGMVRSMLEAGFSPAQVMLVASLAIGIAAGCSTEPVPLSEENQQIMLDNAEAGRKYVLEQQTEAASRAAEGAVKH